MKESYEKFSEGEVAVRVEGWVGRRQRLTGPQRRSVLAAPKPPPPAKAPAAPPVGRSPLAPSEADDRRVLVRGFPKKVSG